MTSTTTPTDRVCSMCGGPTKYLGVFAGNMDGYGCPDRGCGYSFLTSRQESDKVEP